MKFTLVLTALYASIAMFSQAATTVDTTLGWNGTTAIGTFGVPNTATYGQTITVPNVDNVLTGFSFFMNLPASTTFRTYVFAWDGTKATGTALYTSPVMATAGTGTFQEMMSNTGSLALSPGGSFVLFASTSGVVGSSGDTGSLGWQDVSNPYSGGGFVYLNNGSDASSWTTQSWSLTYIVRDLVFKASFSAVPEPSAALLSVMGVPFLLRRRRNNS